MCDVADPGAYDATNRISRIREIALTGVDEVVSIYTLQWMAAKFISKHEEVRTYTIRSTKAFIRWREMIVEVFATKPISIKSYSS